MGGLSSSSVALEWLGAISHARAREILASAFRTDFGRAGTLPELQYAQAVSLVEGGYGQSSYENRQTGERRVINNWGGAQCSQRPPCPSGCYEATDTHAGGASYQACFRVYGSPEEGAAAYLLTLYGGRRSGVLRLAGQGDYMGAVAEQRRTSYFEAPLSQYQAGVDRRVDEVAAALREPRGDSAAVSLIARGRAALPYLAAATILGAAVYTFPRWRREVGL